ncbi:MAG: hypothetical protein II067_00215 [Agathobacter sp.]|uniref:hypothetical protein n=1 Tax=Agathobacter sp. TaxID=2021311 RepID=UPI00257AA3E6|nr:hypothetical protein [Agathobacter sp.]MBQ1680623.1 hypothetical protein [Agathobacter sp.]MCR5677043.1 hypothetical protein [Agathobacter sp.]
MDVKSLQNSIYTNGANSVEKAGSDALNTKVGNLSQNSSEEEMLGAIKEFESYFMEKILKDVKETFSSFGDDEEEDSTMTQITDMYMDSVYEKLADQMLDEVGETVTKQLFEQMKRNYNIPQVPETEES